MPTPQPLPNIRHIVPYKGGESLNTGWKLSSNENPLGCSPLARAAFVEAATSLATYPDGGALALREAIAAKYGLDTERLICGAGSDEIFQMLGRAFLQPGDEVVQSDYGFLVYRLITQQAGATLISAAESEMTSQVDAILNCVTPRTKLVFLANPNNPTGTYLPYAEIKRLHAGLREDILLILDGAYAEYVRNNDYSLGMELAGEAGNVLVTRTFSKVHGLAALRLGWAYGPLDIIDTLNRVRGPFNVSAPAQAAGIAALQDEAFLARSVAHNRDELLRLEAGLKASGYKTYPSVGNFLLVEFAAEGPKQAGAADAFLRGRGIVVRGLQAYGLKDCLRISVGTEAANTDVIASMADFAAQP